MNDDALIPRLHDLTTSRMNRRRLLLGSAALAAGAGAAGTLVRLGFAQDATPAASGDAATVIAEVVAVANAFLDTLSDDERASVLFDWTDDEQKARWSNFPEGLFERDGLMWGNLTEASQTAWLDVMQATLSDEGYTRVLASWAADDALATSDGGGGAAPSGNDNQGGDGGTPPDGGNDGGPGGGNGGGGMSMSYGMQYYWIAIIGTPSETDPWQWQWGGHHITVNATVGGGNIALTPSFVGAQPATYTDADGNEVRPLGDIDDLAFDLINTLDADQQSVAILGDTYIDLVLGPGEDGKVLQPEGLVASDLTSDQQALLIELVGHYTGLLDERMAAARLAEVTPMLDETYLVWYGPTDPGSASYFRVAGPTIVIEYSPQGMGGDAADHIHGIYRDPSNDYGVRYLS